MSVPPVDQGPDDAINVVDDNNVIYSSEPPYDIEIQQEEPSYDIDIQADGAEIGGISQYDIDNDNHNNENDNVVEIVSDSDDEGGGDNAGESSASFQPLINPPSFAVNTDNTTTSVISESQLQTLVRQRRKTEKEEQCLLCMISGPRIDIVTHMKTHHSDVAKPWLCKHCRKGFATRRYMQIHLRVHTGERPYKCDVCGTSFAQYSTLNNHKRLHTGVKPYSCADCGKSFTQLTGLNSHRDRNMCKGRAVRGAVASVVGSVVGGAHVRGAVGSVVGDAVDAAVSGVGGVVGGVDSVEGTQSDSTEGSMFQLEAIESVPDT